MDKAPCLTFDSADREFFVEQYSPKNTQLGFYNGVSLYVALDEEQKRIAYFGKGVKLWFYFDRDDFRFERECGNGVAYGKGVFELLPIYEMEDDEKAQLRTHLEMIQQRIFEHHLTSQLVFVTEAIAVLKYRLFSEL